MNLEEILSQVGLKSETFSIALAVFVIVVLLLVNRKRIHARWKEWRIERSLKQIGIEQLRNLVCPDGLDGYFNIDRLALVQDAILIISYKPYSGNIYCAERISEWTQVVGQKSFKFENPMFDLENQITSLKLLIGNAVVQGYLYFNHSAEFPKGHPQSVLHPANIPDRFLPANCGPANAQTLAAWEALKALKSQAISNHGTRLKT